MCIIVRYNGIGVRNRPEWLFWNRNGTERNLIIILFTGTERNWTGTEFRYFLIDNFSSIILCFSPTLSWFLIQDDLKNDPLVERFEHFWSIWGPIIKIWHILDNHLTYVASNFQTSRSTERCFSVCFIPRKSCFPSLKPLKNWKF